MTIEYYLRENALTSDPDDYNAVVVSKGTASPDDLAQTMIQQGSTLTPEDIAAAFESMTRATVALLNQGFRVTTPVAIISPTIQGVFAGKEDSYDPKRHAARLNANTYGLLEKRWRATSDFDRTESGGRIAPRLDDYHDVTTGTRNGALTPNSVGRVEGKNLKLDPEDPQQGVFFVAEDGTQTRVSMYVKVKPAEVIVATPDLPAGDYGVRVCAGVPGSKDKIRCGDLEKTLTVG